MKNNELYIINLNTILSFCFLYGGKIKATKTNATNYLNSTKPIASLKHTSVRGIGQDVQRSKCWQIDTPFFASQSAILLPSISVLEYNLPIKMIEPLNFANNRLVRMKFEIIINMHSQTK